MTYYFINYTAIAHHLCYKGPISLPCYGLFFVGHQVNGFASTLRHLQIVEGMFRNVDVHCLLIGREVHDNQQDLLSRFTQENILLIGVEQC